MIVTVLLSLLTLVRSAAPGPSLAGTDPCAPAHIVMVGNVIDIHVWRQEGVEPGPHNTITVSTGCGEFIALVEVQKVLEGRLDAKLARVRGELGESCEAPVGLEQERYVIWADGDGSFLSLRRAVALLTTQEGRDAISPLDADALGLRALIEPINFGPMQRFFFAPGGTTERSVKAEGWLVEHGGEYTWSRGAYFDRVIRALGRMPCEPEPPPQSGRALGRPDMKPLRNQNAVDGCACSFWRSTSKGHGEAIFQSDLDGGARINLGGEDIRLELVHESFTPIRPDRNSIGDVTDETYRQGDITLVLHSHSTSECPAENESCETSDERGSITVTRDGSSITLKVVGICGC